MTIADARRALEALAAQHVTDPEALRLLMLKVDEYVFAFAGIDLHDHEQCGCVWCANWRQARRLADG